MVKYKEKFLEMEKRWKRLKAWCIDLRPEVVEHRKKNKIPQLLKKSLFRIEDHGDHYRLYDV